jgi:4-amino-4-deoxy-L-arabinose transferase-like glycosyltransferase
VYGYFIYYNAALMTESLFIVGILATIYICLRLLDRPALSWWMLLGVILGGSILLRQTALFLVPILIAWVLFELWNKRIFLKNWWHPITTVLIVLAIILPWTYRNYATYGQFLLLNSNSGYALYASTHPQLGVSWPADLEEVVVPVPDELSGLNEAQMDRGLSKLTMQNVIADPWRIFRLSLSKSLEYLKFWPSVHSNWISNLVRTLSFGLYAPFMLIGLFLSFKRWRQFMPLYLVCLSFAGLHILSWPAPRYRLPSDAIMMVFAGMAVYQLLQYVSSRRKKSIAVSQARNT